MKANREFAPPNVGMWERVTCSVLSHTWATTQGSVGVSPAVRSAPSAWATGAGAYTSWPWRQSPPVRAACSLYSVFYILYWSMPPHAGRRPYVVDTIRMPIYYRSLFNVIWRGVRRRG